MKKQYLSSYALINFTWNWDYFEHKLVNGFKPRFVLEDFSSFNYNAKKYAFPMVCFCDILMSQLADHIDEYGKYGIGLTKEWGKRNGLNPVLYISSKDSSFLKQIKIAMQALQKMDPLCSNCKSKNLYEKLKTSTISVLRYLKPIEGKQSGKDRIFYDEKEWRFLYEEPNLFFLNENDYNVTKIREDKNNQIEFCLKFAASDIRYLIVKDKSEISKTIKILEKHYPSESQYLTTRILTVTDIEQDF